MSAWHNFVFPMMRYFRSRRVAILREACPELFDNSPKRVCDLGGSRHFWSALPVDLSLKNVTIYNISESETGYCDGPAAAIPIIIYDGNRLPVGDGEFDVVISNSVIEHVAPSARQSFVREMLRTGKRVVVQTPAREFPIEPHFMMPIIHWLPRTLGRLFVRFSPWYILAKPGMQRAESYFAEVSLLNAKEIKTRFPSGVVYREKVIGLTKSYIVSAQSNGYVYHHG